MSWDSQIRQLWEQGKSLNEIFPNLPPHERYCDGKTMHEVVSECKCHKKFSCQCGRMKVKKGGFTCQNNQ